MKDKWHTVALQAIEAAKELTTHQWRAMANRTYYALFAETHARLFESSLRPRRKYGTWTHEQLPWMVRRHLESSLGRRDAREWSQTLRLARQIRECADYRPDMGVDLATVTLAHKRASKLIGASE